MKAVVYHGPGIENFRIEEIGKPEVTEGSILMKNKGCYLGASSVRAILKGHVVYKPNTVLGRMVAGDVEEIGDGVSRFSKGDRITVNPEGYCGKCHFCRIGQPLDCEDKTGITPGGHAEYILIPKSLLPGVYKIPDNVSYAKAAYAETLACCIHGILKSGISFGDSVAVVGSGGVGLTHIQLARSRGATQIIAIDMLEERLKLALKVGATHTINSGRSDLKEEVKKIVGRDGVDVVIEAVGRIETYNIALSLPRKGGTVVAFGGLTPNSFTQLDLNKWHYDSLNLLGSYHFNPPTFKKAVDMIVNGSIDLDPILTHEFPMERIHEAVKAFGTPDCITTFILYN